MIKIKVLSLYLLALMICEFFVIPSIGLSQQQLIAVTEVWPPFRISSPGKQYGFSGIDIDILEGLEKHLGLTITVERHPFARALRMIKTGEADIITGVAYTGDRAKYISYISTSYFEVKPVFYTRKGRGQLIKVYDDLYEFKIGYSLHSAYFEPFNSDSKLNKLGVSTEEQLVRMVALGRVDLIVGTNPNLAYDIKRYGFKDKLEQVHFIPPKNTPVYIGLPAVYDGSALKKKIDNYIKLIINNGELRQIIQKYQ